MDGHPISWFFVIFWSTMLILTQSQRGPQYAFVGAALGTPPSTRMTTARRRCASVNDENINNSETAITSSSSNLPLGFNPLNYNAAAGNRPLRAGMPSTTATLRNSNNIISLRQTQMQQVMGQLLTAVSPSDGSSSSLSVRSVLDEHRDFLLEPLEDDQAVQDHDSIYNHCTTRAERYRAFATTMEERINRTRDASPARQVLTALRDYVLACE